MTLGLAGQADGLISKDNVVSFAELEAYLEENVGKLDSNHVVPQKPSFVSSGKLSLIHI